MGAFEHKVEFWLLHSYLSFINFAWQIGEKYPQKLLIREYAPPRNGIINASCVRTPFVVFRGKVGRKTMNNQHHKQKTITL